MNFEQCTMVANMVSEAKGMNYLLTPELVVAIAKANVAGITDFMYQVKTKDEKIALRVNDLKGNLIVASIISFDEGEDDKTPGNWNYVWTFNEDDIKDARCYTINEDGVKQVVANRAFDDLGMTYSTSDQVAQMAILMFSMLKDFLDANAKEGETFTVELDGYFMASVDVVEEEKVKAFIPDGAMKRLIKDDDAASSNVAE